MCEILIYVNPVLDIVLFRVTDFYFSYIGFHAFIVVFLMFLQNNSTRLCFSFQNNENDVKMGTCVYFSCQFVRKNTILNNSVKI